MKFSIVFISVLISLFLFIEPRSIAGPGDTTVVHTFRFDTNLRQGIFQFPNDPNKTYEKILMLYSMRCKNGLISTQTNPNQGCGEWDYNCFTYIVDSTQTDSLRSYHNSHDISNFNGSSFPYTLSPVYTYTQYQQQQLIINQVISENTAVAGNGTLLLNHPFHTSSSTCRSQYLFTASELGLAGLVAGPVTSLRFDLANLGNSFENLRIRIKHTIQDSLNPDLPETDSLTEVYFLNTYLLSTGWHQFDFYQPFNWDGLSNILVDISFTNNTPGIDNDLLGHDAGGIFSLSSSPDDSYMKLSGGMQVIQVNPSFFDSITDKISIAFWCKGDPDKLPDNTTLLEGVDQYNNRQVNIHMPWSDSRIYWDCGGDAGGYDRIDQAATVEEIEGKWNFWTFTKNAQTGVMRIYKNGALWAGDTGKTRSINLRNFLIGRAVNGSIPYYGSLDEMSIWNTDLDSAAIASIMFRDITSSHPLFTSLQAYYKMNEGSGTSITDSGPYGHHSVMINPGWRQYRGAERFRNFAASTERPNITFVSGLYNTTLNVIPVLDSNLNVATSVIFYMVSNNNLYVVDTSYIYPATYAYILDPDGIKVDSVFIDAQDSILVSQLVYYQRRPMRVELINFITPYGKGLNINGLQGKTWIFDVTDYAPIMKGPRFMAMSDGVYQEDNDITFVFYEGTPERPVKKLQQIWPSGSWVSPSYNDIYDDRYFEARYVPTEANTSQYKVRSAISGHGQEGEFIPRIHTITVNDVNNFPHQVWKACADNPIYPQGGTWVYARAGWCPGAVVDTREIEITSLVTPGQPVKLDYSLPYSMNPGSSNYRVNNQLVSYGAPNFDLNAVLDYIQSPSSRTEDARFNPICNKPVISISNGGTDTLTSVKITYGRTGGDFSEYQWQGKLGFLQSTKVTLPMPDWTSSTSDQFQVFLSEPNASADQYPFNDSAVSYFALPPTYPNHFVVEFKTNTRYWENYYLLTNSNGDTVLFKNSLTANTTYKDTVDLPDDCYTLFLKDTGGDGLSFWANTAQGTGYLRFKGMDNSILKNFGSDFGDNIYLQFMVNYYLSVPEVEVKTGQCILYPNPANDFVRAELNFPANSMARITLTDLTGKMVRKETLRITQQPEIVDLEVQTLKNGMYFMNIRAGDYNETKKLVISR